MSQVRLPRSAPAAPDPAGSTGEPGSLRPSAWAHSRDPRDLRTLLWFGLVTALGVLAARGAEQTTAGLEGDLVQVVSQLPDVVLVVLIVALQAAYVLLFFGIPLTLVATRRWRRWGVYTLGWVLTSLIVSVTSRLVTSDQVLPPAEAVEDLTRAGGWPPSSSVATAVTALILLSPHMNRAWRRFGWAFVAALSALRVTTASEVALDIVLAIGVGGVVGAALLLAFGRRVSVPTATGVQAGLDRVGLYAVGVEPRRPDRSLQVAYRAHLADGRTLHCKVLNARQFEADSLARTYRRVRMRPLGEDVAFSSARRAVAVEAMLAMAAAQAGARTPAVAGVAPLVGEDMVIAYDEIKGTPLDRLPAERFTDDVLDQAWDALAALRSVGIAHRDLQLSSWLLDDTGQLWLIDFSFGEPAATDGALSADLAELLAATYAVVGAQRAVAAATRGVGVLNLATGISHLVPAALTRPTRAGVKA